MTEQKALGKKCPYSFDPELKDFLYCTTTDCMSWCKETDQDGYCQRLVKRQCECALFDMDGIR